MFWTKAVKLWTAADEWQRVLICSGMHPPPLPCSKNRFVVFQHTLLSRALRTLQHLKWAEGPEETHFMLYKAVHLERQRQVIEHNCER